MHGVGVGLLHERRRVLGVGRVTEQIELRRLGRVLAGELHGAAAAADVEHVAASQRKGLAVDRHHARPADIEYSEFAALAEILGAQRVGGRQGQRGLGRRRRADDRAVEIGHRQVDRARLEHRVDHEVRPQRRRVECGVALFIGRVVNPHFGLAHGCFQPLAFLSICGAQAVCSACGRPSACDSASAATRDLTRDRRDLALGETQRRRRHAERADRGAARIKHRDGEATHAVVILLIIDRIALPANGRQLAFERRHARNRLRRSPLER